jgi:hypothetical protein
MQIRSLLTAAVVCALPVASSAAIFTENFDDGNAASRWTTVQKTADAGSNFALDYSTFGIGVPRTGQTTSTGLQLWANRTGGVVTGISAYANGVNLTESAVMEFDMFARFADTAGSTIYATYGMYHSTQDGTWNSISPNATSGRWFTTSSDNGTATAYRAHRAASNIGTAANYLGGSQNGATAGYQALFPDQDGAGANSIAGFILNRWVNVRATRIMETGEIKLEMKNPSDADYTTIFQFVDSDTSQTSGTVTLGMTDPFASLSGLNTYYIFDNLSITAVPEPTSLALVGFGGLALLRRRRA